MVRLSALNDPQRLASLMLLALLLHLVLLFFVEFHWQVPSLKKPPIHKVNVSLAPLPEIAPKATIAAKSLLTAQPSLQTDPVSLQKPDPLKALQPQVMNRRTISSATHEKRDASYLERWQSYIERYGNNHYPEVAIKNHLRGDLRLLVAINKDGSIHEVKIRRSSGSSALDQAAMKLVYQAGPFEPLPSEITQDTEILEIIRTWQFRGKLTTS